MNVTKTTPSTFRILTDEYVFSELESDVAFSFAVTFSCLGALFNGLIFLALTSYQRTKHHITTQFILSLTASDFFFSVITLPILAIKFHEREWVLGDVLCRLFPVFFYVNSAISVFNLVSVTVNRWFIIYFPKVSEKIYTLNKSRMIIVACWITPITLLIPSLLGVWGVHGLDWRSRSCTILKDENGHSPKKMFYVIGLLIPCVALVITNLMIYIKVRMVRQRLEAQLKKTTLRLPRGLKEREQKLTKMMLLIFICFLVTYMPGVIIKVGDSDFNWPLLHVITYAINWASVLVNPIIYVATQQRYRTAFRHLLTRTLSNVFGPEFMESLHSHHQSDQEGVLRRSIRVIKRNSSLAPPAALQMTSTLRKTKNVTRTQFYVDNDDSSGGNSSKRSNRRKKRLLKYLLKVSPSEEMASSSNNDENSEV